MSGRGQDCPAGTATPAGGSTLYMAWGGGIPGIAGGVGSLCTKKVLFVN